MKFSRLLSLAMALGVVSAASLAQAQPVKAPEKEPVQDMVFKDADNLSGDPLGASVGAINVRKGAVRAQLIKPRTTFVPQMLKNVQNL